MIEWGINNLAGFKPLDDKELALVRVNMLETQLADMTHDYLRRHKDACDEMEKRIAAEMKLAECEKDAQRYLHLRDRNHSLERVQCDAGIFNGTSCYHIVGDVRELKSGDELDTAIDAAMKETEK